MRVEDHSSGVRTITLDRRSTLNALDTPTIDMLLDLLERTARDRSVRAVILTGANGAFSAGADLGDLDLRGKDRDQIAPLMHRPMQMGSLLYDMPQPTIAAIRGPAAGGALALAMACDVRIAARDAQFVAPFVHMGLVPDCGLTWLMPRLVGEGQALELMLTGRRIDAATASRIGLITRIADDPIEAALELAALLARRPPSAVMATKQLVRRASSCDLASAIADEAAAQSDAFAGTEFSALFDEWRSARNAE